MKNRIWVWLTILLADLVVAAGVAGIFVPAVYANEAVSWAAQGVGQDLVNVLFVVPALLLTAFYIGRGSKRAAVVWQGLLVYLIYSYLLYSFFMHFNVLFLIYVGILGLSVHLLIASATATEFQFVASRISHTSRRAAGTFLLAASLLFTLQWLGEVIGALAAGTAPRSAQEVGFTVNPVHVIDLALILPAMIIAAVLLWRDRPRGVRYATALLVFMAVMGISILGMFYMMDERGLAVAAAPVVIMSIMVLISAFFAARLLRAV
jgi:hypothetical protein